MVSRWLGYRASAMKPRPLYRVCFWSFLAAWIGIAVLVIIGTYSSQLHAYHSPLIIASFVSPLTHTHEFTYMLLYRVLLRYYCTARSMLHYHNHAMPSSAMSLVL